MKSLLLIDGSSMLTTAYFGTMPSAYYKARTREEKEVIFEKLLQTSSGKYVNAVYPMMKTIVSILKEQQPSHILVAWDLTRNTFRKELYSDYKGTRSETDKPLKEQFATMQELLAELKIPQASSLEFEADDYLGSYAAKFQDEILVNIMTKDRDSLQLCDRNTRVWLVTGKADDLNEKYGIDRSIFNTPKNVFEYTPIYIKEEYSLTPAQLVDLKALVGDTSDNIPGVKGVGEKSGIPLIKEYGTIENLYENIKGLDKKEEKELKLFWKEALGIAKSPLNYLLKEPTEEGEILGEASAILSKKLGEIRLDAPIEHKLEDLEYKFEENKKIMSKIFEEYEFKSLIKNYLK
ncbi:5'-3' exonuclease [Clostridium sp. LP20]|uniref:5'-3' exonuclease n=1 Tax=Clostridium sp. LP20 TaxID=3418665 RepID=UPI003EE4AF16